MKTIYIGKNADNDYVVSEATVSRKHAVITVTDDGKIVIRDLNSLNGTFVNGKRISADTVLGPSDVVVLGKEQIDVKKALASKGKKEMVKRVNLDPNKKVIGRNETCDIKMAHSDVSGEHAVLERLSDGKIALADKGSTNGTFVNGERISYRVLHKGDVITLGNGHKLEWEGLFPQAAKSGKHSSHRLIAAIITICVLIGAGMGVYFWKFASDKKMTAEQIYKKYSSAVCLLYGQYGYTISIDWQNQETAKAALELLECSPSTYYSFDSNGYVREGASEYFGTGFFISADGKMGTNLHIVKPWLYEDEAQKLKNAVQSELAGYSKLYPIVNSLIPNVQVTGHLLYLGVLPNGLPVKKDNLTECITFSSTDDAEKDVAIIQTVTHTLPNGVRAYIDIKDAQTDEKAIEQGKSVSVIGFPYGVTLALTGGEGEDMVIENQIQTGTITQKRGNYEFAHNAPTYGGASGSPVFDEYGKLVGVHHAGLAQLGAHGFNWAIKVSYLLDLNK